MPKAVQRDADDTLTIYIPNRVKMVVLYGKIVVKFIPNSYSCKNVFLDTFGYIDYVLCINLVTPSSIAYANLFAHA